MMGRRMAVADRLERLSLPVESLQHRGDGSILGKGSNTQNIFRVKIKGKRKEKE
jgi:hypothetical protein